jgi:hypothetical protein
MIETEADYEDGREGKARKQGLEFRWYHRETAEDDDEDD